ncbi:putative membrane protein [Microlunatus sagamiharensis]|uniref:Putative membrane protein n=1 Tax=Microlunatus sagamiharensis TaxID=546874 RepID=A0A1H2LM90_9ACTN|nr:DUF1440 domain-containing protein [Microlunatus sagamiharensis]SDU82029.1 putative membrane protein [Microlunatus sagamiharensis]
MPVIPRLLAVSRPSTRRFLPALAGGVLGGVAGGLVKAKWEQVYPPRPEDRTAPPEILLERAGVDPEDGSQVEQAGPPAIHYAFSVTAGTAYAVGAELVPGLRFASGIPYGLGMWGAFHLGLLPALRTAPTPPHQPTQEVWGEASGHIFYILTVEGVRWAVRRLLTGGAEEARAR